MLAHFGFSPVIYANDRLLWAFAIGWIIIACHYGHGTGIRKFFSLNFWVPLERLGLSLYLNHLTTMIFFIQLRKQPADFDWDAIVRRSETIKIAKD